MDVLTGGVSARWTLGFMGDEAVGRLVGLTVVMAVLWINLNQRDALIVNGPHSGRRGRHMMVGTRWMLRWVPRVSVGKF